MKMYNPTQFEAVMIIQPVLATLFVFVFFICKYIFNSAYKYKGNENNYTFDFSPSKLGTHLIDQGS